MNLERVFDLVCHMRNNPGEDYNFDTGIMLNPNDQEVVLRRSIQAFFQMVGNEDKESGKIIQAFSGSSALPTLTKDVFNVTGDIPIFDLNWQAAFKGVALKKGQLSWEIANVAEGMVFELIPEGDKIKYYGISGEKQTVSVYKYGAGIGITWETIEGKKLYQFIALMEKARAKLYELWADIHYGLIDTACALNSTDYQGVATDTTLERDIATLNAGYETIADACKDKGYGDVANIPMIAYIPANLKVRFNQAFRATATDIIRGRRDGAAGSKAGQIVEHPIIPKYTYNSQITTAKIDMVLPGNQIQNAIYLRELGLTEKEISSLSELRAYWTAFGAAVGDSDQCTQLDTAD